MKWIISILILSLLVLVHEYGHFLLAKLNGVEVLEFSIGFGPRLLSTTFHGTRYSLKILPFGGSCRMKSMMEEFDGDEDAMQTKTPPEGCFESVSCGRRASILFAGPFFNFLLALVGAVIIIGTVGYDPADVTYVSPGSAAEAAGLREGDVITSFMGDRVEIGRDIAVWTALHSLKKDEQLTLRYRRGKEEKTVSFLPDVTVRYLLGITYSLKSDRVLLDAVSERSPAEDAGLRAGDILTSVDGQSLTDPESLQAYFAEHPLDGSKVEVTWERDGASHTALIEPYRSESVTTGFAYNLGRVKTTPLGVLKYSLIEIRYQIVTTLRSLAGLFTGRFGVNDLSGPVGIADLVSDTYEQSKPEGTVMTWMNMLNLIVLLSANLGVMNLLPIAGVDGGRLLLVILEAIRGKRLSWKVEGTLVTVTAALLLALMIYVMYNDITKMLP